VNLHIGRRSACNIGRRSCRSVRSTGSGAEAEVSDHMHAQRTPPATGGSVHLCPDDRTWKMSAVAIEISMHGRRAAEVDWDGATSGRVKRRASRSATARELRLRGRFPRSRTDSRTSRRSSARAHARHAHLCPANTRPSMPSNTATV
jgi:hypothetical protein